MTPALRLARVKLGAVTFTHELRDGMYISPLPEASNQWRCGPDACTAPLDERCPCGRAMQGGTANQAAYYPESPSR